MVLKKKMHLEKLGFTEIEIEEQLKHEQKMHDYAGKEALRKIAYSPAMMFTTGIVQKKRC